jgi:L-iditol 2-dehydrogenase
LMLLILGRALGAGKITMIDPNVARLKVAKTFGADHVIDPSTQDPVKSVLELTQGQGVDRIFTACPDVETHKMSIDMIAKRGFINLFGGLAKSAPPFSLLSNSLHYKEAYLTGSHGSTPEQHKTALEMIESEKIDLRPFITHQFTLKDYQSALETAITGQGIKIVIAPNLGD